MEPSIIKTNIKHPPLGWIKKPPLLVAKSPLQGDEMSKLVWDTPITNQRTIMYKLKAKDFNQNQAPKLRSLVGVPPFRGPWCGPLASRLLPKPLPPASFFITLKPSPPPKPQAKWNNRASFFLKKKRSLTQDQQSTIGQRLQFYCHSW